MSPLAPLVEFNRSHCPLLSLFPLELSLSSFPLISLSKTSTVASSATQLIGVCEIRISDFVTAAGLQDQPDAALTKTKIDVLQVIVLKNLKGAFAAKFNSVRVNPKLIFKTISCHYRHNSNPKHGCNHHYNSDDHLGCAPLVSKKTAKQASPVAKESPLTRTKLHPAWKTSKRCGEYYTPPLDCPGILFVLPSLALANRNLLGRYDARAKPKLVFSREHTLTERVLEFLCQFQCRRLQTI